jgi:hypothetical protein
MKSLFVTAVLFFGFATVLYAQTNAATVTSAPTADGTNQTSAAAQPYPVTAIVVSNTITFPILLSKNSEPLMTNAVFRRTFGRKVIFAADIAVQSFDIDKLHPSVIAQLDLDPDKVKADQDNLNKQNQAWAAQYQQQNQQYLAAEAAALAKNQAALAAQAAASTNADPNGAPAAKTHHHKTATPPPAN